jgi:hypothetical protein
VHIFAKSNRAIGQLALAILALAGASLPRAGHVLAPRVGQSAPAGGFVSYFPVISVFRPAVLVGAGDIADCTTGWDEVTADLVSQIPGTVITLGDNAYENGAPDEFTNCYDPSWGRFKDRTRPSPGNHDYLTPAAAGYFGYFGSVANPLSGYYSYDLGGWHIIALNSNCDDIGGCQAGSPEEAWLRADLAAHPTACALAYWHHPRFSSGLHGDDDRFVPIWQALYDYHADLVLNGHDHDYERFAPQTPDGQLDWSHGLREFVVGTGGRQFAVMGAARRPNSEVARDVIYGVIKMSLFPNSYTWEYNPVPGTNFQDSGSYNCH